jgi:hypothetical protein
LHTKVETVAAPKKRDGVEGRNMSNEQINLNVDELSDAELGQVTGGNGGETLPAIDIAYASPVVIDSGKVDAAQPTIPGGKAEFRPIVNPPHSPLD